MQGSSIQNLLVQPDVHNKSILNKQKVLNKKQNMINSRVNELTNVEVEVIARPNNDWRRNNNVKEEVTKFDLPTD